MVEHDEVLMSTTKGFTRRHLLTSLLVAALVICTTMNTRVALHTSPVSPTHVITDVPYVSQETDFFCAFASTTMVLQYYDVNTSLHEVLYNSGSGYSLVYSTPYLPRLPVGIIGTGKWTQDRQFLASLYGLHYENWLADQQLSEQDKWGLYWTHLQEHISADTPVITNLNPMVLPSMRDAIRLELGIPVRFPRINTWLWEHLPVYLYHAIVIVGVNATDNTVCIHDPAAGIYQHPEQGTYRWMSAEQLRKGNKDLSEFNPWMSYSIELFTNIPEEPLNATEIFHQVHPRNLQRLQGKPDVYDPHLSVNWSCNTFGINTIRAVANSTEQGRSRVSTALLYKLLLQYHMYPLEYRVFSVLDDIYPEVFDIPTHLNTVNHFREIAIEKQTMASYLYSIHPLLTNASLADICLYDAQLLKEEGDSWFAMATNYSLFLQKGLFLFIPQGIKALTAVHEHAEQAIDIEQQLLHYAS